MKKSTIAFGLITIAALSFTSCQRENLAEITEPVARDVREMTISTNLDATKTTMGDSWAMAWLAADELNIIHAATGSTDYVSDGLFTTTDEKVAAGEFLGTVSGISNDSYYDWYAFYPYTSTRVKPDGSDDAFCIIGSYATGKETQTGNDSYSHVKGNYVPVFGKASNVKGDAAPAVTMNQGASVIAVKVTNATSDPITVKSIKFTAPSDVIGKFEVNYSDPANPVYTPVADGTSKTATLSVNSGSAIASGAFATFYEVICPFTAGTGETLSISVTTADGTYKKDLVMTSDVQFKPGKIKTLNFSYDKPEPEAKAYSRWTSAIEEGEYLVVYNNEALNTTISGGRAGYDAVTTVDGCITTDNENIMWTVAASGDYWTFYNSNSDVYLASTGSKNSAAMIADGTDDKALWTVTGPSGYQYTIQNKYNSENSVNSYLKKNGTNGYATYGDGTGQSPFLYKLDSRTLSSIAITTPAGTIEFYVQDEFNYTGLVVTATYSSGDPKAVTPVVTAPDMTTAGNKTVTVSYTFGSVTKEVTYDITVTERPVYTITLGDTSEDLVEAESGAGVTLPVRTTTVAGYSFAGWSLTNCSTETTIAPEIISAGTYHPLENQTLYPVFKVTRSMTGWKLITNLSTISEEGVYAILTPSGYKAFNGTMSSGHGQVTTNGFEFADDGSGEMTCATAPDGTCELTLAVSGSGFTMYSEGKGYLYASKAASGGLAWQESEDSYWYWYDSAWAYSKEYSGKYARIKSYNNSSFRIYGNNSNDNPYFAKKESVNVDCYNSAPEE